jgi:hypothetical protein
LPRTAGAPGRAAARAGTAGPGSGGTSGAALDRSAFAISGPAAREAQTECGASVSSLNAPASACASPRAKPPARSAASCRTRQDPQSRQRSGSRGPEFRARPRVRAAPLETRREPRAVWATAFCVSACFAVLALRRATRPDPAAGPVPGF